jgi:ribosome-binding protein aMBF1 (putative translation factor)
MASTKGEDHEVREGSAVVEVCKECTEFEQCGL